MCSSFNLVWRRERVLAWLQSVLFAFLSLIIKKFVYLFWCIGLMIQAIQYSLQFVQFLLQYEFSSFVPFVMYLDVFVTSYLAFMYAFFQMWHCTPRFSISFSIFWCTVDNMIFTSLALSACCLFVHFVTIMLPAMVFFIILQLAIFSTSIVFFVFIALSGWFQVLSSLYQFRHAISIISCTRGCVDVLFPHSCGLLVYLWEIGYHTFRDWIHICA